MDEHLRQPYEGQLIKFTNVVKGWQARWFILNPEIGTLEYYLSESDKHERARGSIQLAGAVISPSDEDSYTFTVSPAAGESYKLRATDTKDRQMWLNRLRVVAEMHTRAIAHNHPPLAPREHRTPGNNNAGNSHQVASAPPMGLAVLDAFTQVAEVLEEARRQHSALVTAIEDMPSYGTGMRCTEPNLLLLKATSQATLLCLDQCLGVLRTQHMSAPHHQPSPPVTSIKVGSLGARCSPLLGRSPRFHRRTASDASSAFLQRRRSSPTPTRLGSPSLHSSSPSLRVRTAPHSPTPGTTQGISAIPPSSLTGQPPAPLTSSALGDVLDITGNSRSSSITSVTPTSTPTPPLLQSSRAGASENSSEISDEDGPDGDGELGEVGDGQRSIIMHIISQLRLGMDLTRVTLPTFILERRSLLEMFADFLGHPDYFVRIGDAKTPEERIQQVVKWYLTSIHVGRNGSVAKKPYNPIIGEVFHCSWRIPRDSNTSSENTEASDGKPAEGKKSSYITIKFSAEQVSHHPPVSAFYFECPEKQLSINAHIWTKSKFMGMSVGVNLVGDITLVIGNVQESYSLAMPSAYARSILTEPWVELGGRVNISSPETGCQAVIVFHTKPFYGGKLHRVTAEVKNAAGLTLTRVQGEWDSVLEFNYANGVQENIDVNDIPMVCVKRLRPIAQQAPNESRRLWLDVSVALARGDVETATSHKRALEEMQRKEERERAARNAAFPTQLFSSPSTDHWVYNHLPSYAFTSCPVTTQSQ
ncbi:oxysterol-binding protein-related protein 11-like isoform X2 [Homarus americanus]|nr:oxysterol-binding protein-related protein 11-like isoform X2 [Homarus americanus]XP_042240495.1 oxysterol-binding protein-related protein 11-like isoform X2 [Homarus americanus]XP_042240496.1 oxysterol-binding protein-related protein 11-like isoform X2 [Homarus americanus]XP_042240497.1 oxysterol-binding protein-related protein 11-like isoform X2 [Homarus americanus]XP_042240498.1 oxysterol-binding protein-related protein 11-like isoform X2 [Homarus americanus]XP_042240499.1 oxysterol-bindi